MRNPFPLVTALIALASSAALVASGCSKQPSAQQEFFPAPGEDAMTPAIQAQVARGARLDGTLYAHHFDGVILNGLGREKLKLMAADASSTPTLMVYLDLRGADPRIDGRRAAVLQHLADAGVAAERLRIEVGPNPDTLHPANPKDTTDLTPATASGSAAVMPEQR